MKGNGRLDMEVEFVNWFWDTMMSRVAIKWIEVDVIWGGVGKFDVTDEGNGEVTKVATGSGSREG